jgi:hypothetical protein
LKVTFNIHYSNIMNILTVVHLFKKNSTVYGNAFFIMVLKRVLKMSSNSWIQTQCDTVFLFIGLIARHITCLITLNRPTKFCLNLLELQSPMVWCGSHFTWGLYKCILHKHHNEKLLGLSSKEVGDMYI